MVTVFVYGTLLDDARVRAVTGRIFSRRRAELRGHRRVWPTGRYPYLVADPSASVHGDLLEDVDPAALEALDAYEDVGTLYIRDEAVVSCGAEQVRCFVYRALEPRG